MGERKRERERLSKKDGEINGKREGEGVRVRERRGEREGEGEAVWRLLQGIGMNKKHT